MNSDDILIALIHDEETREVKGWLYRSHIGRDRKYNFHERNGKVKVFTEEERNLILQERR